jgi:hypothetical protein
MSHEFQAAQDKILELQDLVRVKDQALHDQKEDISHELRSIYTDEIVELKGTVQSMNSHVHTLEAAIGRNSLSTSMANEQALALRNQVELDEQRQSHLKILVDCLMAQIGSLRDSLTTLTQTDEKLVPYSNFQAALLKAIIPVENDLDKHFHEVRLLSVHLHTVLQYCKASSLITGYMRNCIQSQNQGSVDYSTSPQQRELLQEVIKILENIKTNAVTKSRTLEHENRPQFVFALVMHKEGIDDLVKLCKSTISSPHMGIDIWPTFCRVNNNIFLSAPTATVISSLPPAVSTTSPQPSALAKTFNSPSQAGPKTTVTSSPLPLAVSTYSPQPSALAKTFNSPSQARPKTPLSEKPSPLNRQLPFSVSSASSSSQPDVNYLFQTVNSPSISQTSAVDTYGALSRQIPTSSSSSSSSSSSIPPDTSSSNN